MNGLMMPSVIKGRIIVIRRGFSLAACTPKPRDSTNATVYLSFITPPFSFNEFLKYRQAGPEEWRSRNND